VLGGLGFSLKPHFLLAWILVELLLLSRLGARAIRRPEVGALVGFGMVYFFVVLLLVPGYLPMAFRLGPWYDRYLNNGIAITTMLAGPVLLVTAFVALAQRAAARQEDPLASSLTLTFLGFFAAAILQRKGFNYHFLAASAFGLVLLVRGWQVLDPRLGMRLSSLLARSGALLALFTMLRGSADAARELSRPGADRYRTDPTYPRLLPVVKQLAGGQPILVLSSNPAAGWPLTRDANTVWASRYMSLWPLPALHHQQLWTRPYRILRGREGGPVPQFEHDFRNEVMQDLLRWQPRLIIVPVADSTVTGWGGAFRIDYLGYFDADPRFRDFMQDFSPADRIGPYTLWVRRGP
jgi:hypothetical protein